MPMKGGGGGGSKAVEAGGAFVRIFGKDNLTAMLTKMKARVLEFAKVLNTVGTASLKVGAAMALPLTALLAKGVSRAAEFDKLGESFGVSAEQLSRLAYAADVAGVSLEEVYQNQRKYTDLINSAPTTDASTIKSADSAMRSFRGTLVSLQSALAPLIESFAPLAKALSDTARDNPNLIRTFAAVAAGLIGLGIALKVAAMVAPLFSAAFAAMPIVLAAAPWLLGALAIGALTAALIVGAKQTGMFAEQFKILGGVADKVFGFIKSIALDLYKTVGTTMGGVMDALKAGDIDLAGEIGMKGLEVSWKRVVLALTEVWVGFKDIVVDGWHSLASGAMIAFRGIGPSLEKFFLQLWERVKNAFFDVLRGIVGAAQDVLRQLPRGERLAAELDPIKGQLDTTQIELTEGNKAAQQKVDAGLAQMLSEEEGKLKKRLDENKRFREDQLGEARKGLLESSAELDALRVKAAAAATAAMMPGTPDLLRFKELFTGIPSKPDLFKQARGGFGSGASLGQFGYGDKGSERADLKSIAKNTGGMMTELTKLLIEFKKTNEKLEGKFAVVGE